MKQEKKKQLLKKALEYHHGGDLHSADDIYLEILKHDENDFDDGINATDGNDELDQADTMVVVGGYRFKLPREHYMKWRDEIRADVGFEESDVNAEIQRRLGF